MYNVRQILYSVSYIDIAALHLYEMTIFAREY